MGVFEMDNGKTYCLGSAVALQPPMRLHPTGQQRFFWVPRMGVFETHHAKKHGVGSGVALQQPIALWTRKGVFLYLGWGCLKCTMP